MQIQLIEEWKKAYKFYSIWFFVIIGALPELFNLAVQSGLIDSETAPQALSRLISLIAFAGAASRMIQQKKLQMESQGALEAAPVVADVSEDKASNDPA